MPVSDAVTLAALRDRVRQFVPQAQPQARRRDPNARSGRRQPGETEAFGTVFNLEPA